LVEQLTLNQRVPGSSPGALTIETKQYQTIRPRRSLRAGVTVPQSDHVVTN
jgi:hypothetical protein